MHDIAHNHGNSDLIIIDRSTLEENNLTSHSIHIHRLILIYSSVASPLLWRDSFYNAKLYLVKICDLFCTINYDINIRAPACPTLTEIPFAPVRNLILDISVTCA